mgnify:FL=1
MFDELPGGFVKRVALVFSRNFVCSLPGQIANAGDALLLHLKTGGGGSGGVDAELETGGFAAGLKHLRAAAFGDGQPGSAVRGVQEAFSGGGASEPV